MAKRSGATQKGADIRGPNLSGHSNPIKGKRGRAPKIGADISGPVATSKSERKGHKNG